MLDLCTIVLMKGFGLWLFYPLKERCILFQIPIFFIKLPYSLTKFLLSWIELLMENCEQANLPWFINSIFICHAPSVYKVWHFESLVLS